MPDHQWNEMLAEASSEVLETMFFTGVMGAAQPDPADTWPRLTARLSFDGQPSGVLTLRVSEPAARALAANFLASEGDELPSATQLGGVACELANMVCGSLLSRLGSQNHFRLTSPELVSPDAGPPPEPPDQSLDLGDGVIDLWLRVDQHAV